MPTKPIPQPVETPAGQLSEACLHYVLGYQLAQATIVTDKVFQGCAGTPFGLRPVEYTVLALVAENPGGSMVRLARALAVTAPHITAVVDRLEAKGWIQRTQSESDKRSQVLHATALGADLARQATGQILAAEKLAIGHLSLGEQTLLVELLHKVACGREPSTL